MSGSTINAGTFKSRLKKLITLKHKVNGDKNYDTSVIKNFKLTLSNKIDWSKYASVATKKLKSADEDSTSLFTDLSSLSSDLQNEQSLSELFDVVLSNQDILDAIDANNDKSVDANEMESYFSELAAADGNDKDLTLEDFGKFLFNKVGSTNESFLEAEIEKLEAELEEIEKEEANNPTGPGGHHPHSNGNDDDDGNGKVDPFPQQRDLSSASGRDIQNYVKDNNANIKTLAGLKSADLAKEFAGEGTDLSLMDTLSQEARQKLQEAAAEKEAASSEMATAKEAAAAEEDAGNQEITALIDNVSSLSESQASAQEEYNNSVALQQSYVQQIDEFSASISTIDGSISSLQGQIEAVPAEKRDDKGNVTNRNEIAQVIANNNAIKAAIAELEAEKTQLQEQQTEVQKQKEEIDKTIETQKQSLEDVQKQLEDAQNELNTAKEAHEAEMSEVQKTYMDSVTKYQEASEKYTNVKSEVMQSMNEDNKTNASKADTMLKTEQLEVTKPTVTDDNYHFIDTMNLLNAAVNGEKPDFSNNEEAKQLWEQYSKFDDKDKDTIKTLYGSEGAFLAILTAVGDTESIVTDKDGKYIKFRDILLNKENYSAISDYIEGIKVDKEGKIDKESIKKMLDKYTDITTKGENEVPTAEAIALSFALTAYQDLREAVLEAVEAGADENTKSEDLINRFTILYPSLFSQFSDEEVKAGSCDKLKEAAKNMARRKLVIEQAVREIEEDNNKKTDDTDASDASETDEAKEPKEEETDNVENKDNEGDQDDKDKEKEKKEANG